MKPYPDVERARIALAKLRSALEDLKQIGARRTADRVRLAISSCKGAVRNEGYRRERAARIQYEIGQQGGDA